MTPEEFIRVIQGRTGKGVKELAEAIDTTTATVSKVLNGQDVASLKTLSGVLRAVNLKIGDVLIAPAENTVSQLREHRILELCRMLGEDQQNVIITMMTELAKLKGIVRAPPKAKRRRALST